MGCSPNFVDFFKFPYDLSVRGDVEKTYFWHPADMDPKFMMDPRGFLRKINVFAPLFVRLQA